jgi:TolB-like protein
MSLFTELKRRNVFRVGLFYIVSAWLVIQVAETLLPVFEVSDSAIRAIVLILVLGFPLALVFSWIFELTPEGLKLDKNAQADPEAKQQISHKLNVATLIAAVLAIGLLVADRIIPESGTSVPETADTTPGAEAGPVDASGSTSIAVLAFENMSPDPDNAYFAEGISEEILNVLVSVGDLRVASRTSAFSFAGTQTPIPQIAEQLNVDHVLEGSVRKAGNRVRITAQLIAAADDVHLWSDVYDRELDDIFAVQEEIAQAIAIALKDRLGVQNVRVSAPTENLEAYQLFLRGRQMFYARGTTLDAAIADLRRAVELDPGFGAAWAVLAAAYQVAPGYWTEINDDEAYQEGRSALAQALSLVPDNALAIAVQANTKADDGDWVDAIETGEHAARLPTQDSTPKLWHALDLLMVGFIHRAHQAALVAWEADPLVGINNGILAITALSVGDRTGAERHADFAGQNGWPHALHLLATDACARGDREKAIDLAQRWIDRLGLSPELLRRASEFIDTTGCPPQNQAGGIQSENVDARLLMLVGQTDAYFERRRTSVEQRGNFAPPWLRGMWQPASRPFREHPVFFEIAERFGLVEFWETRGYPDGCTRTSGEAGPNLECTDAMP